ncbi:hypothetical protein BRY73_08515 [Ochrobactrum sp. P6BS-III]|uniref:hypothetical protein n=1 Tax=unclassified Ochrobactrum TaxID=239106 RepID=UPI0009928F04|nr:hypothetical protein [Ochrobactrum sp. P6BSIII]OOL18088.1 hypothetical protein BRY73_08515 [Ochrobactrum sp. P6BS-III]
MITVDIRTKIIPNDARVYVIRPGAYYRLFDQFIDKSFVGVELPKLALPSFSEFSELNDVGERILRSIALRKWFAAGQPLGEYPPQELEFYSALELDHAGGQFLRFVKAFFQEIRKGDVVVMPPRSFKKDAIIGEFTDEPNEVVSFASPVYPNHPLNGRNVKWLARLPKSELPAQTLDRLQKPSVVFLLERSAWPKIFRTCYGAYSTDSEYSAEFRITEEQFQASDDFLIQAFFNFVTANTEKLRRNDENLSGLRDAAFQNVRDFSPSLYTNVNSPGSIALKSGYITPIVIAVMLTLAVTVGAEAVNAAESDTITFGNSLSADDACTAKVKKQVVNQLRLLGFDRWSEACNKIREAAENTGIKTNTLVQTEK